MTTLYYDDVTNFFSGAAVRLYSDPDHVFRVGDITYNAESGGFDVDLVNGEFGEFSKLEAAKYWALAIAIEENLV